MQARDYKHELELDAASGLLSYLGGNTISHIRNSSWLLCIYCLLSLLHGMVNAHQAPWQRPCFLSLIGYCGDDCRVTHGCSPWIMLKVSKTSWVSSAHGLPFGKLMLQCLDRQHCRMQAAWILSQRGLAVFHILLDCNLYIFRQRVGLRWPPRKSASTRSPTPDVLSIQYRLLGLDQAREYKRVILPKTKTWKCLQALRIWACGWSLLAVSM